MPKNERKSERKSPITPNRARLALATELGWLDGYPTRAAAESLEWQQLPLSAAPAHLTIDRERLHRANRSLRQIHRDFAPVLPKVLEEPVGRWRERTQRLLDRVGEGVMGGVVPQPPETPRGPEALLPLRRALGWRFAADPAGLSAALAALEQAPEPFTRLLARPDGLRLAALLLAWATVDRPALALGVLPNLIESTEGIPGWSNYLMGMKTLRHLALGELSDPEEELSLQAPLAFDQVILDLAELSRAERRVGLELLGALRPPFEQNRAFWLEFRAIAERTRALGIPPGQAVTPADSPARQRVNERIDALGATLPPRWYPSRVNKALRWAARARHAGPQLVRALPALRAITGCDGAALALVYWSQMSDSPRLGRHIARWARSIAQAGGALQDRLDRWNRLRRVWSAPATAQHATPASPTNPQPDALLLERREALTTRYYDWLDRQSGPPPNSSHPSTIVEILDATDDDGQASRVLAAWNFAEVGPKRIGAMLQMDRLVDPEHLLRLGQRDTSELEAIARAMCWLKTPLLPSDSKLIELGLMLELIEREGQLCPALPPEPPPLRVPGFPPEADAALDALARFHPDAAGRARRLLDALAPPDSALDAEIAALEARVQADAPDSPRRRRLESLRRRRALARALGPTQARKLAARARTAAIGACADWATGVLRERMDELKREIVSPDSPDAVAIWTTLTGLSALSPELRALAAKLLRRRSGPPPRDLRDEPPNRAFLDSLRARGVRVEPWLGEYPARFSPPGLPPYTLALETDPIEILRMGQHFGTCLSPGVQNFYSAVVNAADINKRVLYIRDARGRVVGRTLLALDDQGDILVYHLYVHERRELLNSFMRTFVASLAADMGVALAASGTPRRLMSREWYDDDSVDHLAWTQGQLLESKLLSALDAVQPGDLTQLLREALHPVRLSAPVWEQVAHHPVLARRPELVDEVVRGLVGGEGPTVHARVSAAAALARAGRPAEGRQLLPKLRRGQLDGMCCDYRVFIDELVGMDPRFILQLLRLRRDHHMETMDAYGQGRALEAIGRRTAAIGSYRFAIDNAQSYESQAADKARERLDALLRA